MIAADGAHDVLKQSLSGDGRFARGLNAYKGHLTYQKVAEDLGMMDQYAEAAELM